MRTRLFVGLTAIVLALAVQPILGPSGVTPRAVEAAPIIFQTDMYGQEQVPAVRTAAWGFVRFYFNEAKTEADYTVDVKGLSGSLIAGADIHRGARGVNGPVIRHLADGGFIVTSGHMRFSTSDLNDMAAGNWYVSLKTYEYPKGELRGQIALPPGFWTAPAAEPIALLPLPDPGEDLNVSFAPVQQFALGGQLLPEPSAMCYGSVASVEFAWSPLPGALTQWLDLSYYDNGFAEGTFYGGGPLYGFDRSLIWDFIAAGVPFYWRVNAETLQGWAPSTTGYYVPC